MLQAYVAEDVEFDILYKVGVAGADICTLAVAIELS